MEKGQLDANLARLHKYCEEHYRSSLTGGVIVDICIHCHSEIILVRHECYYCFEKEAKLKCSTCNCLLCDSCLDKSCLYCRYKEHLCTNCRAFSLSTKAQKCSHILCEVCIENFEGACEECYKTKVCEQCDNWDINTCFRVNRRYLCNKCFASNKNSSTCKCGQGILGSCKKCDDNQKLLKTQSEKFLPKKNIEVKNEESNFSTVTQNFGNRNLSACMGCSIYGRVFEAECKHSLCSECIKLPCRMCELINEGDQNSSSVKNNKNVQNSNARNQKLESCIVCNKKSVLEKKWCDHPRCAECCRKTCAICEILKEPASEKKNNYTATKKETCFICKNFKEISQHRKCGHLICNNCVNAPCCGQKKKNKQKNNEIGKCEMCNRPEIIIKKMFCGHWRCNACVNLECEVCNPKKCRSCGKVEELTEHPQCGAFICAECITGRCLFCKPHQICSNCGKSAEGIELSCNHKFMCHECVEFVEDGKCIFHGEALHCTNHGVCKFSINTYGFLIKDCSGEKFCLHCKKIIKKNSDSKKHNKCKK